MRKGQRFTPTKIAKWSKQGRGTGTLSDYEPWHQVTRSDPSSRGRSQILQWVRTGRSHHFLSDGESDAFAFITMLPNVVDVREQVPLGLSEHTVQLAAYSALHGTYVAQGTLACADVLSIKHPMLKSRDTSAPWVMTTDIVAALQIGVGQFELLAISVKPSEDLEIPRKRDLLRIEQAYWTSQSVQWLLISPQLYDHKISTTVRTALPWGLPKREVDVAAAAHMEFCANHSRSFAGRPLTEVLRFLSSSLHISMTRAQQTFWQSVWQSRLKLDLRRSTWPSVPVQFLDECEFLEQNPIASRRSVCI